MVLAVGPEWAALWEDHIFSVYINLDDVPETKLADHVDLVEVILWVMLFVLKIKEKLKEL